MSLQFAFWKSGTEGRMFEGYDIMVTGVCHTFQKKIVIRLVINSNVIVDDKVVQIGMTTAYFEGRKN